MYQLKKRECRELAEYVTKYRQLISRVKDICELDKITLFTRGLVSQTRAEFVYRRCSTVHQAINVAIVHTLSSCMDPAGFPDRQFNEPGTRITVDLLETRIRFRLVSHNLNPWI